MHVILIEFRTLYITVGKVKSNAVTEKVTIVINNQIELESIDRSIGK